MILLTTEYLDEYGVYVVTPYSYGRQCDQEYLFATEDVTALFCKYYYINPIAAQFAYLSSR